MNYYLFLAMLIAAAAGLAHLAVSLVLRGRTRDIASLVLIAAIAGAGAVGAATTNLPRDLYLSFFSEPDLAAEVRTMIADENLGWLFADEAELAGFAEEAAAAAGSRWRLDATAAPMITERTKAQMRLMRDADIAKVTGVIEAAMAAMAYFIDNAQFQNCRTFLLGGYDFPGADAAVIAALNDPIRMAVESGRLGEKNWTETGDDEIAAYNLKTVAHLRGLGYDDAQLLALSRTDTTDPAEMESNCRISHEFFRHMLAEYPAEVAATVYVGAI